MIYFKFIIIKNTLIPAFLFLLISACSSKETSVELQSKQPSYKKIAEERYNQDYRVSFNKDSTYLIVYYLPQNVNKKLPSPLKFFVYDTVNKKMVFQDNLTNGKVEWINDHQIKVSMIPGIVTSDEEKNKRLYGYTYDVKLKRKIYGNKEIQRP